MQRFARDVPPVRLLISPLLPNCPDARHTHSPNPCRRSTPPIPMTQCGHVPYTWSHSYMLVCCEYYADTVASTSRYTHRRNHVFKLRFAAATAAWTRILQCAAEQPRCAATTTSVARRIGVSESFAGSLRESATVRQLPRILPSTIRPKTIQRSTTTTRRLRTAESARALRRGKGVRRVEPRVWTRIRLRLNKCACTCARPCKATSAKTLSRRKAQALRRRRRLI
jgi:hypothetical protein